MANTNNTGSTLTIGDTTRDGLLQIVDTNWNGDGIMRVTVRETMGGGALVGGFPLARARRLARRTLPYPDKTRSSRVVRRFVAEGCEHVTFDVSRLK